MFNLPQLKDIFDKKQAGEPYDRVKHQEILSMLRYATNSFDLSIPEH